MTSPSFHRHQALGCLQFRRLIPLHVGGDLDDAMGPSFDHHVTGCPSCRARLDEYVRHRGLLSQVGRTQDADHRAPDVWTSLRGKLDRPGARRLWPPRGF